MKRPRESEEVDGERGGENGEEREGEPRRCGEQTREMKRRGVDCGQWGEVKGNLEAMDERGKIMIRECGKVRKGRVEGDIYL